MYYLLPDNKLYKGSVWANLSIITNNKTFKIEALVDSVSMKAIQIEVVFQQLTDDDGNPYWDIKTAKYLFTESFRKDIVVRPGYIFSF